MKYLAVLLAMTIGVFYLSKESFAAKANLPFLSQIEKDIQSAIRANKNARTYADWRKSGFLPKDIISNSIALKAVATFCHILGKLKSKDAVLFMSESRNLGCKLNTQTHADLADAYVDSSDKVIRKSAAPKRDNLIQWISPEKNLDASSFREGDFALIILGLSQEGTLKQALRTLRSEKIKAHIFLRPSLAKGELGRLIEDESQILGIDLIGDALSLAPSIASVKRQLRSQTSGIVYLPKSISKKELVETINENGMKTISGVIHPKDWKMSTERKVVEAFKSAMTRAKKGIIALHLDNPSSLDALYASLRLFRQESKRMVLLK